MAMTSRLAGWLLAVMLFVSGSLAVDDYIYDEEAEEEVASLHVPVFSSRPQMFDVTAGDTVTLPCLMDKAVSVIIWKSSSPSGDNVYFMGPIKNTQDARFKLDEGGSKGNSLIINDVRPSDSGSYMCEVSSSPPVSLNHTVNVKFAPVVRTTPDGGVVVINQGAATSLVCEAEGNPKPTVTWTRKGGLLPGGQKKLEGMKLEIPSVDRRHMGNYACTVDNGIGDAIVKDFRLEVNFAPEIDERTSIKATTGAGYEARLICTVHGQPMPEVTWSRVGGEPLDKMHHKQGHDGNRYSLTIDEVMDSDMGQYTCRAKSSLGTAAAVIELTGRPNEVVVTSSPKGQQKDSYTLRWNVESYAPIEEYKVIYKIAKVNGSAPKQQWEQVTVAAPEQDDDSIMYTHMHVLRDLEPATTYEAVVTAKNKYGWSQEATKPFELSTLGAHGPAADLKGGEALGSKDPNAASSLRSGAMAAMAALCALVVVL